MVLCCLGQLTFAALSAAQTPPREHWRASCFVYRDANHNGRYDMGDRPFAGLAIEMIRPDGTTTQQRSNLGGFTNFSISLDNKEEYDVFEPGVHTINVVPLEGLYTHAEVNHQRLRFVEAPLAGGGLVPEETCHHIGIAPLLDISGRVDGLPAEATIHAENNNQEIKQGSIAPDGSFLVDAKTGDWTVTIRSKEGEELLRREVTVAGHPVVLSRMRIPVDTSPAPLTGDIQTLDFDTLTTSDTLFEMPEGYGGLGFRNWISTHHKFYNGYGYVNATISGEYIIYNSSGYPAFIWDDEPFDFVGSYVGLAWPRGEEQPVQIKVWRGEALVHQERLTLSVNSPVYYDADFHQITKIEIGHGNYERVVLDDFSIRR